MPVLSIDRMLNPLPLSSPPRPPFQENLTLPVPDHQLVVRRPCSCVYILNKCRWSSDQAQIATTVTVQENEAMVIEYNTSPET